MGRRRRAINSNFSLDSGDIHDLPRDEIRSILRGAESIIAAGGRTTLVGILRGSKAKKILPFADNPAYGCLAENSQTLVEQKVDWCIESGFLAIKKEDGFPLLAYSDKGLMIECFTIAEEALITLQVDPEKLFSEIKDYPLKTVNAMLDLIADGGPEIYAASLLEWEKIGTKRMRARIRKIFAEWEGIQPPERYSFEVCFLDEGLSELEWNHFLSDARKKLGLGTGEVRFISKQNPGMADVDIYEQISAMSRVCFVTADRPFHNSLLEKKFPSFYYDKNKRTLSRHQIEGVKPRGIFAEMGEQTISRQAVTSDQKYPDQKPVPGFLYPSREKQQKRARTKRRRIKNYFGGVCRMEECRVTVSIIHGEKSSVLGFRANITSNSNLKALDATESYLMVDLRENPSIGFSIVLGQLRLLGIRDIPVVFYYDKSAIPTIPEESLGGGDLELWKALCDEADFRPAFIETSSKSARMDRLQKKLNAISTGQTNELVLFDYEDMLARFAQESQSAPQSD